MATALPTPRRPLRPVCTLTHAVTAVALAAGLAASLPVQAGVIQHADVNGFRTFQDTNTGRVWLDLDSFVNTQHQLLPGIASTNDMRAAMASGGFVIAREADVRQLLGSVTLDPVNPSIWSQLESVMSSQSGAPYYGPQYGLNEELLAGYMLFDYSNDIAVAVGRQTQSAWAYGGIGGMQDNINFAPESFVGYGMWAYFDSTAVGNHVPEPSALLLASLALGLAVKRKR